MNPARAHRHMWFNTIAASVTFLGAFLLFFVQPMTGKMILPWYGGSPAVWTTCMLFFQVMLLGGYSYAAALVRHFKPSRQMAIHLALLISTFFLLPITPSSRWQPTDGDQPTLRILAMLLACVGWPYLLLSATSPLLQAWFTQRNGDRSPYRLYALSNLGSLGALLLYPFVVEPTLTTSQQGNLWSIGMVVFVSGVGIASWWQWVSRNELKNLGASNAVTESDVHVGAWQDRMVWLLMPALASMLLLSVTNYLCQDIAVVPFLWIAPLALYLVSLIICFDHDRWYRPLWYSTTVMLAIIVAVDITVLEFFQRFNGNRLSLATRTDIRWVIGVYLTLFFLVCMICHGETVRRRPIASRLTEFYLLVATGGALGGFVVTILCPAIFSSYVEFNLELGLAFVLAASIFLKNRWPVWCQRNGKRIRLFATGLGISMLVAIMAQWLGTQSSNVLPQVRNFYGVLSVRERFANEPDHHGLALFHGATMHGFQFLSKERRNLPTTYFTEDSGIGMAMKAARQSNAEEPGFQQSNAELKKYARNLKVGIVGLGIGTLASYSQPGDQFRFYEINPLVIQIAYEPFMFLHDAAAQVEVIAGDARLSLEREEPQQFDVLILDAFNSDSVPAHLLTDEAMAIYLRHTKPDGLIAFQVTNRHIDLVSVVARHALKHHLDTALIRQETTVYFEKSPSAWFLMSRNARLLEDRAIRESKLPVKIDDSFPVWTDGYHNLFQILR